MYVVYSQNGKDMTRYYNADLHVAVLAIYGGSWEWLVAGYTRLEVRTLTHLMAPFQPRIRYAELVVDTYFVPCRVFYEPIR